MMCFPVGLRFSMMIDIIIYLFYRHNYEYFGIS